MERLTDKRMRGEGFITVDPKEYKAFIRNENPTGKQIYQRLLEIEEILGEDYDLDQLRKLVEEDRAGRCKTLEKIVLEYQETIVPGYRKLAEKAMEERDAAISDMETVMAYGGANVDTCQFCKNGQCYARGGTKLCLPKWRGS